MRWERRGGVILHALSYLLQQSRSYGRATGPSVFFWQLQSQRIYPHSAGGFGVMMMRKRIEANDRFSMCMRCVLAGTRQYTLALCLSSPRGYTLNLIESVSRGASKASQQIAQHSTTQKQNAFCQLHTFPSIRLYWHAGESCNSPKLSDGSYSHYN